MDGRTCYIIVVVIAVALIMLNIFMYSTPASRYNAEHHSEHYSLNNTNIPILYESIVDTFTLKHRGVEELKKIISKLNADLMFKAFWKRRQPPEIYDTLRDVISELKSVKEDIVIVDGAVRVLMVRGRFI